MGTACVRLAVQGDGRLQLTDFDCVWLLSTLKQLSAGMDKNSNAHASTRHALKSFCTLRQGHEESMEACHRRFESSVATAEMSKGNLLAHDKLTACELDRNKQDPEKLGEDSFLAIAFLENADSVRFSTL